jgi:hypothetical protein
MDGLSAFFESGFSIPLFSLPIARFLMSVDGFRMLQPSRESHDLMVRYTCKPS